MAGTRWLRAATAFAADHVSRQREAEAGPDETAFWRQFAVFQKSPRYLASQFSELEANLIAEYARAACAYHRPNASRRFLAIQAKKNGDGPRPIEIIEDWAPAWVIEGHGLWAGGNPFGEDLT